MSVAMETSLLLPGLLDSPCLFLEGMPCPAQLAPPLQSFLRTASPAPQAPKRGDFSRDSLGEPLQECSHEALIHLLVFPLCEVVSKAGTSDLQTP